MAQVQSLKIKVIKEMDSMLHSWNCWSFSLNEQSPIKINLAMAVTQCPNSAYMIMLKDNCKMPIFCNCANDRIKVQM